MSYHLAGCCSPLKGDNIVGIVTAGIGVAVHTVDCETLTSYSDNPERWLNISWDQSNKLNIASNARIGVVLKNQKIINVLLVYHFFLTNLLISLF